jgi:hypothetical protein
LYIKPSVAQLTAANPVNLTKFYSINATGSNGIVPKQSSAITQNNTTFAPLSSNSSSYLSHPMPRVNHLSLPTNFKSSPPSSSGHHHGIYGKNYPGLHYYISGQAPAAAVHHKVTVHHKAHATSSQASTAAVHHKVTVHHKAHATSKVHHKVIAVIPEMHGEPTTAAVQ